MVTRSAVGAFTADDAACSSPVAYQAEAVVDLVNNYRFEEGPMQLLNHLVYDITGYPLQCAFNPGI